MVVRSAKYPEAIDFLFNPYYSVLQYLMINFVKHTIKIFEYRVFNFHMWLDFGKPTIYTQETLKIITSISSNLKYNIG